MASEQIVTLYRIIREQPEVWADLNTAADTADLTAKVSIIAARNGIALSPEDIRCALMDLPDIIAETAGDDALTDDELELVAAGGQVNCSSEEIKGFG